ncbi:MAG: hypothetical protein ACKOPU_02670 [Candidatus Planktophila sp.]
MKRFLLAAFAISLTTQISASAAPKTIVATEVTKIASIAPYEGAVITSLGVTTFSNYEKKIEVSTVDFTGTQRWTIKLDTLSDQIAMAATSEKDGNIWLAGMSATSTLSQLESATAPATNVDGVAVEPIPGLRDELNSVTVWKISPTGGLIATYVDSQTAPTLITAISHSISGLSIIGDRGAGTILISMTATGKFSSSKTIGTAKSSFTSIYRNSDGSANIYGSSSETLGGKKAAGVRDGILAKVNKSGAITSIIRSSAQSASRSWKSATSTIFLVGDVKVGGKNETAFTKFNSSFSPTWTLRLPSNGAILAASSANGSHYALFNSTSSIAGVSGWKPASATAIILRFDSKGVITQALKAPQIKSADAMAFIPGVGIIIVSSTGIFKG